jgi:general nucleoside transport system permease protein
MAGLAGTIEMMGNQHRFGSALSNNTGYTGIVVAVLAGGSAIGVVAMAIVFALIAIVGGIMRAEGTSSDIIFAMYGITLIVASIAQGLSSFKVVRRPPPSLDEDLTTEGRYSGEQAAMEKPSVN